MAFPREFLQLTRESAYLTPKTTPTRGTDVICIRLEEGNSFTPRANPVAIDYVYGGGYNVVAGTLSDKTEVKGTLKTFLTYPQASFLLGAALSQINSGQTSPWTTTEPPNQYVSFTADHAVWQDDTGSYKRTRYLGCKVDSGSLSVSEQTRRVALTLELNGSTYQGNTFDSSADPNDTVFPKPADNEYPATGDYVLFSHSNGQFLIDSAPFTQYLSLNFAWQTNHVVDFFASRFAQQQRSWGRKFTLESDVRLRSSPNFRAAFQTLASKALALSFTDGTRSIALDFHGNARIEGLADDLPIGGNYQRKLTMGSRYDSTAGTDFTFTYDDGA